MQVNLCEYVEKIKIEFEFRLKCCDLNEKVKIQFWSTGIGQQQHNRFDTCHCHCIRSDIDCIDPICSDHILVHKLLLVRYSHLHIDHFHCSWNWVLSSFQRIKSKSLNFIWNFLKKRRRMKTVKHFHPIINEVFFQ